MAVSVASGPKNGHFWPFLPVEGSTLNFGPNLTKLGRIVRITKKMNNYECAGGPGPNYGETAVFAFCRKAEKRPKIRFLHRTPDSVNGPFVALDDIFDLAPLDRFLNFSFQS